MTIVAKSPTFVIPLTGIQPGTISGDLEIGHGFSTSSHFIADQANFGLKYLCQPGQLRASDWPLVLFGPSGTGKTAIALSIAGQMVPNSNRNPRKIIAWSASDFCRRFNNAIETNTTDQFRRNMTSAACLFIDNLNDLEKHGTAQNELACLIDLLSNQQIPIICTANEHWSLSDGLTPQLYSRLISGLCLNVNPPGQDARRIIVAEAAEQLGFEITNEAIDYLAPILTVTFPKIRLFFSSLKTWLKSKATEQPASTEKPAPTAPIRVGPIDKSLLVKFFAFSNRKSQSDTRDAIVADVCQAFQLKISDLKSNSRKQSTVLARGVAIYLLRHLLNMSFAKIGQVLGGRDHSTIMHALKRTEALVRNDDYETTSVIRDIEQSIIESILIDLDIDYG